MTDKEKDAAARGDDGPGNFVAELVEQDLASGATGARLMTRFPPEPNGYLHIGHAKAICLNFGLSELAPQGVCNLRFDDTNPAVEDTEYVDSIQADIAWLGFDWQDRLYFASDYFQQLHDWAVLLIGKGLAYVDSQTGDEIRAGRGSFHEEGVDSPHRGRTVEENLALFAQMKDGELDEGAAVLRAKIDMKHKDLKKRDPLMYRIRKVHHHRTGDDWCIYPMYDWAHGQSDAIEGVTHSVCTLEFLNHRPLYEWFHEAIGIPQAERPRQIEFARLALSYTVLSKRKLVELVADGHVAGWDDPRLPTLAGMRRAGYPPTAIVTFADRVGVATKNGVVDVGLLEHALREDLNATSPRVMAVLRPLKVVITNYPEDRADLFDLPVNPGDDSAGVRQVPFSRELWVERDDFMEEPMKKWWRLAPGREVRLRGACLVTCDEVVKDDAGQVVELRCSWDPESLGGTPKDGRKVKGTIHWVSAEHALEAEVRLYDRLFSVEDPLEDTEGGWLANINESSLEVLTDSKVESTVGGAGAGARYQFERLGYFAVDPDSTDEALVFNRTIGLRDSWAKIAKKQGGKKTGK